jgi:hypothetical protein
MLCISVAKATTNQTFGTSALKMSFFLSGYFLSWVSKKEKIASSKNLFAFVFLFRFTAVNSVPSHRLKLLQFGPRDRARVGQLIALGILHNAACLVSLD